MTSVSISNETSILEDLKITSTSERKPITFASVDPVATLKMIVVSELVAIMSCWEENQFSSEMWILAS